MKHHWQPLMVLPERGLEHGGHRPSRPVNTASPSKKLVPARRPATPTGDADGRAAMAIGVRVAGCTVAGRRKASAFAKRAQGGVDTYS